MKRRVFRRARAKLDAIDLASYIARDNWTASARFLNALEAAFGMLLRMPKAGAIPRGLNPVLRGLRVWPVKGFKKHLIFYRETADGIEIIRILHSSRDIRSAIESKKEK